MAKNCQMDNNLAMIIELVIAGIVAIILSLYFFSREQKAQGKLKEIIETQHELRQQRRQYALHTINAKLRRAKILIFSENKIVIPEEMKIRKEAYENYEDELTMFYAGLSHLVPIDETIKISFDVLDSDFVEKLRILIELARAGKKPYDVVEWSEKNAKLIVIYLEDCLDHEHKK